MMTIRSDQSDAAKFQGAADDFAALPDDAKSIATMMELAFTARDGATKHRARVWLREFCNIVCFDEGFVHAPATPPRNLLH